MKKIIFMLIGLISMNYYITPEENQEREQIKSIAIEVARSIKYYDNQPNYYPGANEFEGQCGDYAALRREHEVNESHPNSCLE